MTSSSEQKLEQTARSLSERTKRKPDDPITIFKGFRKVEEQRLRMWHNAGGGGREITRQRSDLVDILFRELFEGVVSSLAPNGLSGRLCVAAFGGYGRRELTPFSDVDILFLQSSAKQDKEVEEVIRQTLVVLWDLGFKVGHATRTIPQAIKKANEDMITKTSMLESRFLAGERDIFNKFKQRFQAECVLGCEKEYIAWRLDNQAELRIKHGSTVFLQEPNVKNGIGGLRDYQSLLWISQFKLGLTTTAKLVEAKFLRETERRLLESGYDFLLRTRTEMHYLNDRAVDTLTLQLQGKVAVAFNYQQKTILRKVEAFMRDFYSHTRNIHLLTEAALQRMEARPVKKPAGLLSMFGARPKIEKFDGFLARQGRIEPESREIFNEDPYRMIRAFHHAQVRQLEFHAELSDLVRRRLPLVNRTFQYARAARETFFAILSRKGEVGPVLRLMHNLGFLGRYMPEFGALDCLVQHEFYHRYTADEHTLVCIEKLDAMLFADSEKLSGYRKIFQKIEDPAILYLALLLHDTGKSANERNHEEASAVLAHKVARRLQLSPERRRMLITLVDSHYVLSKMSQSRNLEDPATIEEFARIVLNRQNLDALMLITLADGMGTSDQNWSDWKEGLVWSLYRKTCQFLEGGPTAVQELRRSREQQQQEILRRLGRDFAEEAEAHFQFMPDRYFQMFEYEEVAAHLRLFRTFFENQKKDDSLALAPVFHWIPRPEQSHSEVWVCGWDRPRLLERIAGAFLSAQINILSADIFTRSDSLALDIFRVASTQHEPVSSQRDITRVETRLADSLAVEDYDFTPLISKEARLRAYRLSQDFDLPTRITIENSSHPIYTLLDIQTPDRLGLLYDLLRAMGSAGLIIELSRITTEMDVAMDSFYIHSKDGQKISEPAAIKRLQRLLQRAAVKVEK
ncbi:MAG: [protein-PII] uridylyltransferase [Verrucomicrobiota bacterium]